MSHIRDFLLRLERTGEMEYEDDADLEEHVSELRQQIEPLLVQELLKRDMSDKQIRDFIEDKVDEKIE
jgi:hypothetical protein